MDRTHPKDSIFHAITFEELIETVQANEPEINEESVMRTYKNILAARESEAQHELKAKLAWIVKEAKR